MNHFQYHFKEVRTSPEGIRKNTVNIVDGKGNKTVKIYNKKGKVMKNKTMKLNKNEISNIQNLKFMPNLFETKMRQGNRSTRRRRH